MVTPDGTIIQASPVLVFASGRRYTIVGGVIQKSGVPDTRTRNVTAIGKLGTTLYQVNTAGDYYQIADVAGPAATAGTWSGGGTTPIGPFVGTTPVLPPPPAPPAPGANFSVSNGRIIAPNGLPWFGRGPDVAPWGQPVFGSVQPPATTPMTASFPKVNLYGIYCMSDEGYSVNTALYPIIDALTAQGIVVVLHSCNSAYTQSCPTGSDLAAEAAALAQFGTHYLNNPYVWPESSNEPEGAVTPEHVAVYNAWRATGNKNIVVLCGATNAQLTASAYAGMTNIAWDLHVYPWNSPNITQGLVAACAAITGIRSADGAIPAIIGEFGPSSSGSLPEDGPSLPNWVMSLAPYSDLGSGNLLVGWSGWGINTDGSADEYYAGGGTSGGLSPLGLEIAAGIAGNQLPTPSAERVAAARPFAVKGYGASTYGGLRWKARRMLDA